MAKLTYTAITSLDGYVADERGSWDWSTPDEEVHAFVNDLERGTGTFLLGRLMYDVLAVWETIETEGEPAVFADYKAIWLGADKVVYSRTLERSRSERTRIERVFEPEAIRDLKASANSDISVGGPNLASQALAAGLVDEINLLVSPVVIGRGSPALPRDQRIHLELLEQRRFVNGVVHVRYRVVSDC